MDKIVCVGKNYSDHAKELGDAIPDKPVLFLKPKSILRAAIDHEELELSIPTNSSSLHYEAEIVLRLDKGGYQLDLKDAEKAIGAVSVGLDMTLRDLQTVQKKNGHPWTTSKVFPDSAIVGPWLRLSEFSNYLDEKFTFSLDDKIKQESFGKHMIMNPVECVSYISKFFPLVAGDLIFTGTPAGVGPVSSGQRGVLSFGSIRYSVIWSS
ncbi:fumarylacetoacetate hydrolase family protein [Spirobacillus cienkowskii]|uniref:FAA hydrolase family protein n=1 Tax=Spirobacillus cienkowskii TaxID=495820 RepID=A0A369KQV4_9BACT|nr:MAG: FAA hydrolase family protein [Spirobacillus cienkowskii]